MTAKRRTFDFPGRVDLRDVMGVVRAALEDEGLTISPANTRGDQPRAILVDDPGLGQVTRVILPPTRIVTK